MKKLFSLLLLSLASGVAMADGFPYFAFETADGGVKTLSVEGLKITYADGTMTAQNNETSYSVATASLTKMYFSSSPTGISSAETQATAEGEVYNLQGIRVATTSTKGEIQGVPNGVYVVKEKGKTRKVVVK